VKELHARGVHFVKVWVDDRAGTVPKVQPKVYRAIIAEAHSNGIKVLEDCAEAVGATYKGKSVGQYGDIAIFSFQYHKFMTSGEGGMVAARSSAPMTIRMTV
jgi:dTDP-4-amino-4,6-dideoxygalactose transaminase